MIASLKRQLPHTLKLAFPIIITQVGQMAMGLVDILMVGKLGPQAIGGVAVGSAVFSISTMSAAGLLSGLDHFISKSCGERNIEEADTWLLQGFYLALLTSIPLVGINMIAGNNLPFFGVPPETAAYAKSFLQIYNLSTPAFLIFFSQRQYLQAMGFAKTVTLVTLLGNITNILMNWVFIYGHWGFSPLGIQGSALSTLINRLLMMGALVYLSYHKAHFPSWKLHWDSFKKILRLGLPAALQNLFEIGVFSLSTVLASRLDPYSLAAHSLVLNIASLTFMFPLGISYAAAVRVGFYLGENKRKESFEAGYSALFLGLLVMLISALLLVIFGKATISLFTQSSKVIDIGYKILLIAAVFQVADGIQVVASGALRGLGETRISAAVNLVGHWGVGLPLAVYLCFYKNLGLPGLWSGLSAGLFIVALVLLLEWHRRSTCSPT